MRTIWRQFYNNATYGRNSTDDAKHIAENFCKLYDLDNKPAVISDFLFDLIRFEETDEDYWNRQARAMVAIGTVRIETGGKTYIVEEQKDA